MFGRILLKDWGCSNVSGTGCSTLAELRYSIMGTFLAVRTFWELPTCEKRASNKETPPEGRRFIYQSESLWLLPRAHLGINQVLRQEEKLYWMLGLSIATISVLTVLFENQRSLKDQIEYLALKKKKSVITW